MLAYLRLNGVKARDHPVFKELNRVKQYFDKIKVVEIPAVITERHVAVDKGAAARFIKAGLVGLFAGTDELLLMLFFRQAMTSTTRSMLGET